MAKSFFKNISKKISNATSNLFNENNEFIKDIFYSFQSNKITITEEQYNSEYIPLNRYYKKEEYTSNPILYIAVVSFNQKKGSIIEFTYPDKTQLLEQNETSKLFFESLVINSDKKLDTIEKVFDNINNQLTYLCMPDGAHSLTSDSQFFIIQNFSKILFGISCYRQLQVTEAMKEDEQENKRDCVQKAMCIVSLVPLFGQMASKLSVTMLAYFNQDSLKNKKIIEDLYSNYSLNYMSKVKVSEILESFSLKRLIYFTRDKIFSLIKLIMLEKKILVYSHISNNICSFMFSFLSLFPGGAFFSMDNKGRPKTYFDCYSPYGLPLKFLNKNSLIYSILTLYDIEKIEGKNIISYFIGTTNPLLMNYNKIEFDCIINLDEDKITINKKINSNLLHLSKKESKIMNKLYKECKSLFNEDNTDDMDDNWMLDKEENKKGKNLKKKKSKKIEKKSIYLQNTNENFTLFEGSDDYIRNIFTKYITNFLSDIHLSQYITNSDNYDNETKISKIKDILDEYNCNFVLNWITKTKNFLFWNYERDANLWRLSPHLKKCKNVTKFYENGDIYEGELAFGEPNKHGKLEFTIKEIPYTYVGEFSNGQKEGKGNLFSKDNKFNYDGEWKNDKYDGFGALYDDGEKYTGDFKNGKFNGKGTLYKTNGDILEGEFFEGQLKKGTISYKNGEKYEGQLEKGVINGKGTYKYKNGDVFKGKFIEGKKQFGIYEYSEGGKYEGYFENELFNGEGILIDKNGEESKGIFKDGKFIEKLDKLKIELDNEIFSDGVNIQIKQNDDDWEIAEIKKVPDINIVKSTNKDNDKKKEEEINNEINEKEQEEKINNINIEIKINNIIGEENVNKKEEENINKIVEENVNKNEEENINKIEEEKVNKNGEENINNIEEENVNKNGQDEVYQVDGNKINKIEEDYINKIEKEKMNINEEENINKIQEDNLNKNEDENTSKENEKNDNNMYDNKFNEIDDDDDDIEIIGYTNNCESKNEEKIENDNNDKESE